MPLTSSKTKKAIAWANRWRKARKKRRAEELDERTEIGHELNDMKLEYEEEVKTEKDIESAHHYDQERAKAVRFLYDSLRNKSIDNHRIEESLRHIQGSIVKELKILHETLKFLSDEEEKENAF